MKIKECKLRKVISCDKKETIVNVAKKLKKNKERHIIITDNKKPVGIISTTDINNRVVAENKDPKKITAEKIMTSKILIKDVEESITRTYVDMIKRHVFSCPITKNEKLVGTLDMKEVMNHIVKLKAK